MKATEDSTLENILDLEKGNEILQKHGVPCMSCPMAAQELSSLTIGEVCHIYKLGLNQILNDLNA